MQLWGTEAKVAANCGWLSDPNLIKSTHLRPLNKNTCSNAIVFVFHFPFLILKRTDLSLELTTSSSLLYIQTSELVIHAVHSHVSSFLRFFDQYVSSFGSLLDLWFCFNNQLYCSFSDMFSSLTISVTLALASLLTQALQLFPSADNFSIFSKLCDCFCCKVLIGFFFCVVNERQT